MLTQSKRTCSWLAVLAAVGATAGCTTPAPSEVSPEEVAQVAQAVTMPTHVVEGYWHNFYNSSVCPMRLTSVASYWDVIHVAFADNAGSGNVAFNLYTPAAGEPCAAMDPAQFKADIATLKGQGKNVVLSLGGAAGAIAIGSTSDQTNFVSSLKNILSTWGFSGIDVDLESGSSFTHGSQIQTLLPGAIQTLSSWYSTAPGLGGHMFLSMAPEHPYVHGGVVAYSGIWGSYLPMITTLSSQLDFLHTQLYNNSSVSTPNVAPYNGQNFPVDSVDNLVASVKMLVEGFDTAGGPHFNGIAASQVAFGVPSGPKSSNPPFISTTTINKAYDCITANTNCGTLHMNSVQPSFRGVMTWSINWDAYDVANNTAGRVDFANIKSHMGGAGCTPTTCSAQGKNCGSISDGCGGTLSCGSCTSPQTCGGGGTANVCGGGTSGPDRTEGGTATGTGSACSTTEDVTKLYDNQMTSTTFSKWCVLSAPSTSTPISTAYTFGGGSAYAITSYTITTGNDSAGRDPKDWTLQGCAGSCTVGSDSGWTTVDTRTGQFAGAARYQTNTYTVAGGTGYQQYRLRVTANNGDTGTFQMGELQMFGNAVASCTAESDASFCSRLGKNCGSVTANDNCGNNRTVSSCGSCASPQTCGGGGTANVCGGGSGSVTTVDDGTLGTGANQFNYVSAGWGHCGPCGDGSAVGMYNQSNSWDSTTNDFLTVGFSGTQIALYGVKDTSNGIAAVSIDGGAETNVDFFGTSRVGNQLLWTSPTLASGSHTFKVRVTGTKNASSSNFYVVPDRVDVTSGGSCTPTTCAAQGKNCGSISDGCGGTLSCGSCTSPQTCGGGGTANVCGGGSSGTDRTEGGAAAGTGTSCNSSTEDVTKLYDNLMTSSSFSKWCVSSAPSTATPISTMYTFGGSSTYAVTSYTITTANDAATRDPKDWTFQGCTGSCTVGSDSGWVTLDTRTGQFAGAARYQTNTFSFTNSTAYRQFRLRVTANNGDTGTFQMAELQMFGNAGSSCTPETDSAFCSRLAKNCGSVTANDNCGTSRTVSSCGSCTSPQTCGGGGTANVCGGGGGSTCATAYAQGNCNTYTQGTQVSSGGHNWTCSNGNCANCAGYTSCAPGGSGCPWGVVWNDNGACQ